MIYTQKINIDFQVKSLEDLPKLKPFLEDGTLKVNKSQIARELGKDRRTVDKYLNGYEKPTTRHKGSPIDAYYDIIKELLSDENQQIFYYKRVLWQFLKDNHQLNCAQSSFRRYISHHPEFQSYFDRKRKNYSHKNSHMRFETALGQQAQLDWKESIHFILKSGEAVAHALGQAAVGLALPVGLIGRSGVDDIAVAVVVDRGRLLGNGHHWGAVWPC